MTDVPSAKTAQQRLEAPLLQALMDRTPASFRRAGTAIAGVAVPFANAWIQSHYGFGVSDTVLIAIEGVLGAYIGQSVLNEIHDRSSAVAATKASTPESAIEDLNRGPRP